MMGTFQQWAEKFTNVTFIERFSLEQIPHKTRSTTGVCPCIFHSLCIAHNIYMRSQLRYTYIGDMSVDKWKRNFCPAVFCTTAYSKYSCIPYYRYIIISIVESSNKVNQYTTILLTQQSAQRDLIYMYRAWKYLDRADQLWGVYL